VLPFRVEWIIIIVPHSSWSILMSGILVVYHPLKILDIFCSLLMTSLTWLGCYLLKERSEVFSVIELFFNEIKKISFLLQFMCFVLTIPWNVKKCIYFLFQNGIIHQTSCSHRSQQNGVVEGKNRHIPHVARAIIIHMSVPKYLWSDAVLSACHLINRMPSSVLDKKISFFLSISY